MRITRPREAYSSFPSLRCGICTSPTPLSNIHSDYSHCAHTCIKCGVHPESTFREGVLVSGTASLFEGGNNSRTAKIQLTVAQSTQFKCWWHILALLNYHSIIPLCFAQLRLGLAMLLALGWVGTVTWPCQMQLAIGGIESCRRFVST